MKYHLVGLIMVVLYLFPLNANANCRSMSFEEANRFTWMNFNHRNYTICYDNRYSHDIGFVRHWMNNAFQIGIEKYGVTLPVDRRDYELDITLFLTPEPTARSSERTATVICCQDSKSLEIFILTPSHNNWKNWEGFWPGGGRQTFIKFLTHEMMNTLHYDTRENYQYGRDKLIPRWILEGLAEYEGFFSTTNSNKRHAREWLINYGYEDLRDQIMYGRSLLTRVNTIVSIDRYAGSAIVMWYFAEKFGPEFHLELFKMDLNQVIRNYGSNPLLAFNEMRQWLEKKYKTNN